jgi:hypothetical protein
MDFFPAIGKEIAIKNERKRDSERWRVCGCEYKYTSAKSVSSLSLARFVHTNH